MRRWISVGSERNFTVGWGSRLGFGGSDLVALLGLMVSCLIGSASMQLHVSEVVGVEILEVVLGGG